MTRATLIKSEIQDENTRFLGICLETQNSIIVLLSEGEDKLGTLAVSVPSSVKIRSQSPLSSVLLGDRNTTTARMIAERLAAKYSKISLVSIYLKSRSEVDTAPLLIRLFEKMTTEKEEKHEDLKPENGV
jgi:hypothetical protein